MKVRITQLPPSEGILRSFKVGDILDVVPPNAGEVQMALNPGMKVVLDPVHHNRHTVYANEYQIVEFDLSDPTKG